MQINISLVYFTFTAIYILVVSNQSFLKCLGGEQFVVRQLWWWYHAPITHYDDMLLDFSMKQKLCFNQSRAKISYVSLCVHLLPNNRANIFQTDCGRFC